MRRKAELYADYADGGANLGAARAASKAPPSPAELKKTIISKFHELSRRHRLWQVFRDGMAMFACALSNAVDLRNYADREADYLSTVKRYSREEVQLFCEILGCLRLRMQQEKADILGELYMELELGNEFAGQFFTPYHLCQVMARLNVGDELPKLIEKNGFVTVNDPAVGAGALIIAFSEMLEEQGLSPTAHMHATVVDVDLTAVHMAYIQLSEYGIPATVVHGNSLTLKEHSHWYTPAHVLMGWGRKLRQADAIENESSNNAPDADTAAPAP